MYLEGINSPSDLKKIDKDKLNILAEEIRQAMLNRFRKIGGHFGSNFGMVEAEIALHYVFNSPIDKIVFDVSHQSYTHKILTGRKDAFLNEENFNDISGYTNPKESEHDIFSIGHTSTSISLACGLVKGRDLTCGKENIIAVIGDGSLSGGEALEGLNFVGSEINSNLIILVNDNGQAIAENHGGIYKNLEELRNTNGNFSNNIFKNFGLDYIYEAEGNNIEKLIEVFEKVKDINHPIVVHIKTQKGKGYKIAEENIEAWHWANPFDIDTGLTLNRSSKKETYEEITGKFLINKIKADKSVVVVTPAMPKSIGFNDIRRKEAKKQFIDVGIAEEHAVALISGIAKNGGKPVLGTNATFIQRSYDQISHDLCLNDSSATILVNKPTIFQGNSATHLGIFTISEFNSIPNLVMLAPTSKQEYLAMLDWSIDQNEHPVMILIPGNNVISDGRVPDKDYSMLNKFKVESLGKKVAIIATGDFYQLGQEVEKEILQKLGFKPTLINPRYVSGIDEELLYNISKTHELVITLEDGVGFGGFGINIASYLSDKDIKVKNYSLSKKFYDKFNLENVLDENELNVIKIFEYIKNNVNLKE